MLRKALEARLPVIHAHGLDGKGVPIGIVDTGFNFAFLNAGERAHTLDQNGSLAPTGAGIGAGGQVEGSHGTLVAYWLVDSDVAARVRGTSQFQASANPGVVTAEM